MSELIRNYSELITLPTFMERYLYCRIHNNVGDTTFGGSRYLNQILYTLPNYREFRNSIILRDMGCDLAMLDHPINDKIFVHHLNPLTIDDVRERRPCCMDPENVIAVSFRTHNAIHYGDESLLATDPVIRTPNDMIPWKVAK